VAAGRDEGEERRGDGVHAGGGHQGRLGSLQRADLVLQHLHRRVAVAPVLEAVAPAFLEGDEVLGALEPVRRAAHDRGGDRVCLGASASANHVRALLPEVLPSVHGESLVGGALCSWLMMGVAGGGGGDQLLEQRLRCSRAQGRDALVPGRMERLDKTALVLRE